jgi:hypothetical protein
MFWDRDGADQEIRESETGRCADLAALQSTAPTVRHRRTRMAK